MHLGLPATTLGSILYNRLQCYAILTVSSVGARLVISFDQGRSIIEREHWKRYPDIVTSSLPDKIILEKVASDHSFQITEFVDESDLYLAVLKAI